MTKEELSNSWTGIVDIGSKNAVFREAIATGTLQLSNDGIKLNITAVFTIEQVKNIINNLNQNTPTVISIFSGRIADAGIDPVKYFSKCIENIKENSNIEFLWASPREIYNLFHAEDAGADIITISQDLINKIPNIGKDLSLYSKGINTYKFNLNFQNYFSSFS